MNEITTQATDMIAHIEDGWWHVTEPGNPKLINLFGTPTLPTPWSYLVPADDVKQMLEGLNPGRTIKIA